MPGRTVEQNALRRLDAQFLKYLWMLYGQLNYLSHTLHLRMQAAHVLVGGSGGFDGANALGRLFQQQDLGSFAYDHHTIRMGLGDHQRHSLHAPHKRMGLQSS